MYTCFFLRKGRMGGTDRTRDLVLNKKILIVEIENSLFLEDKKGIVMVTRDGVVRESRSRKILDLCNCDF